MNIYGYLAIFMPTLFGYMAWSASYNSLFAHRQKMKQLEIERLREQRKLLELQKDGNISLQK